MEAEESGNIAKMREIQKKLKNKQLNVDSSLRGKNFDKKIVKICFKKKRNSK